MNVDDAKSLLRDVAARSGAICETAKKAARHRKSLSGDNFYARKFHDHVVALSSSESKLTRYLSAVEDDGDASGKLERALGVLKSAGASLGQRVESFKSLRLLCESALLPKLDGLVASSVPSSEGVLPMDVVHGTRPYIEKVVLQANGCYEHQWYDACSVMIRRLVETLIIEVYEAQKRADEIKNGNGHFLMLSGLVTKIMGDPAFNLGRELTDSGGGLPLLKSLGDRAAHNRFYTAKKADIDKVTHHLRVIVEELLHRAGLKK
jgi:hypothetical protein